MAGGTIQRNQKGFIETGHELTAYTDFKQTWKLKRDTFLLEISMPSIFAAGDVRARAMSRVASAIGRFGGNSILCTNTLPKTKTTNENPKA